MSLTWPQVIWLACLTIPAGVWVDSRTHPTVQNSNRNLSFRLFAVSAGILSSDPRRARVAELADARDLGSRGQPWGFKSPLSHQLKMSTEDVFVPIHTKETRDR
jgi:hypothetical protein